MDYVGWFLVLLGVAALILYGISNPKQRAQLWIGGALVIIGLIFVVL